MTWKSGFDINQYIEQTLLDYCTDEDIEELCRVALEYKFFGVCVQPGYVKYGVDFLSGSDVKTITVVDFPYGANKTVVKARIADLAIRDGADELDMVMNLSRFFNGNLRAVEEDIKEVKKVAQSKILKVIIQSPLLSGEQILTALDIVISSGAEFVKTSTGVITNPTSVEEVKLIEANAGGKILIKASGGIRSFDTAVEMIKAGAVRIGTSSGVMIAEEEKYER